MKALVQTIQDDKRNAAYEIQEFRHNCGLYYEKVGRLHHAKETWKLVIKLDLTTLSERYRQIIDYLKETEKMCEKKNFDDVYHKETCENLDKIAKKEMNYLTIIIEQLQTIYEQPTNRRRGLIDGIGSIAKSLFGTMDANDEKRINEQLNLLENSQQILQHAVKNQIKVINATIIHVGKLKDIMERKEKAYMVRVKEEYLFREEITEHFT